MAARVYFFAINRSTREVYVGRAARVPRPSRGWPIAVAKPRALSHWDTSALVEAWVIAELPARHRDAFIKSLLQPYSGWGYRLVGTPATQRLATRR